MTYRHEKSARGVRGVKKVLAKIRRKIRRRIQMAKPGPVPRVFTPGPWTR